jgi:CheY-like chemotaxis protein
MNALTLIRTQTLAPAIARPARRLLVADDNELDRQLAVMHLKQARPFEQDLPVECASDGEEALQRLRHGSFALVVLDWNMPRLDGGEVLRSMRDEGMHIPVLVLSGRHHAEIANDLKSMRAAFVNKNELNLASFRGGIAAAIQSVRNDCEHG